MRNGRTNHHPATWPATASGGRILPRDLPLRRAIAAAALPARYGKDRSLSTAIYYLLTPDSFSSLHRLQSDEIFHFYAGDPVTMLQLHGDGRGETIVLGQDIAAGQQLQVVVPEACGRGCF